MPRCTRSIMLVLIGTGLAVPGCDERSRHGSSTPGGQGGSFADGPPTTSSTGNGGGGYGSSGSHYGPNYYGTHAGGGWIGRPSYVGGGVGTRSGGSSGGSDAPAVSHGTSFGGFGAHASAGHGGE
jgi:hypothetical protein